MSRSLIMIFMFIFWVTACAQVDGAKVVQDDEFTKAAMSWEGADIREMLTAWPDPNISCGEDKEIEVGGYEEGRAGCVRWLYKQQNSGVQPASGAPYGNTVSQWTYLHCEAIAKFRADLIITVVDVRFSHRCSNLFSKDGFTQMTR